ncbi:MAG: undecaprenyl-phosphate glucose phosphotransferase [Fusicatenibacter sp.]|nr:undecaprenyl-phosphate glucose phosphotransferase [Lachnospiraceae bacterium]MDY2939137.1 undecaprenyl-phosphate glucose phosphotransferase [Fusicatenibacter sp.]
MINENQKYFTRMHVLVDAVVIAVSYILAWFFYVRLDVFHNHLPRGVLPPATYMLALTYIVPCYLILYYAFNLYTSKRIQGRRLEIANIVKANTVGFLVWLAGLYMVHQIHFSRGMLSIFFVTNVVLEICVRAAIRGILSNMWKKGRNQKQILMVGYSRAAEEYIDRIIANPEWGYVVRGILDDHVEAGTMYRGVKVLGRINNLMVILPENRLDEIAITLGLNEYFRLEEIVSMCEKSGVHTQFVPDYHNIIPTKPYTEDLQGLPVVNIRYVPLSNTFNATIKRIVDIIGSIVAIILFSPVMLLAVIGIKLTSPGPLIYRQTRVGLHNKPFEMYKFRSMEVQSEEKEKKAWTVKDDPRVTGFGKFMRHTSIDELPQLFNILKGDMSLVGPRPERPFFVEKFREEIPRYMVKHQVRPGLTGWAQVNGYRGDTSIRKRIDCDLYYIENWTLGLDFKILFLTFFKGFVNKNAY